MLEKDKLALTGAAAAAVGLIGGVILGKRKTQEKTKTELPQKWIKVGQG